MCVQACRHHFSRQFIAHLAGKRGRFIGNLGTALECRWWKKLICLVQQPCINIVSANTLLALPCLITRHTDNLLVLVALSTRIIYLFTITFGQIVVIHNIWSELEHKIYLEKFFSSNKTNFILLSLKVEKLYPAIYRGICFLVTKYNFHSPQLCTSNMAT